MAAAAETDDDDRGVGEMWSLGFEEVVGGGGGLGRGGGGGGDGGGARGDGEGCVLSCRGPVSADAEERERSRTQLACAGLCMEKMPTSRQP